MQIPIISIDHLTSFTALLPGNGPQDAEQTLPGFLASGLDFADWVELAAPRPVAIVGFENDFFPIAGVKETYVKETEYSDASSRAHRDYHLPWRQLYASGHGSRRL